MNLIFREHLLPSDQESIRKLVTDTSFFYANEVEMMSELINDRLLKNEKSDYQFILAQENDNPLSLIGYCCYGHVPCTQSSYRLYWIAVDKNKQNRKIGKQLLTFLEKRIVHRGGTHLYAETSGRALYHPTHAFYARNQFILEARLKNYFAPGDDELIFSKVLG